MDPLSIPGGQKWVYFCSTGSSFWDTGRVWKLPYLGMKPGIWKSARSCIWSPSLKPRGSKLSLFSLYAQRFPRYGPIFEITIFGHEPWDLKKGPEVAYGPSFYPRGSKLSLFSLYGQRFPRYGLIFKITIFGHETWNLKKVPEVAYGPSFYTSRSTLSIFSYISGSNFWDTGRFSKLLYWGMKCGIWKKFQKLLMDSLSTLGGQNIAFFFFALQASVSEIRADFQNCHIWVWNLKFEKSGRSCPLSTTGGQNWGYFRSMDSGFPVTAILTFNWGIPFSDGIPYGLADFFFSPPSAAEYGLLGDQTEWRKPCIDLLF